MMSQPAGPCTASVSVHGSLSAAAAPGPVAAVLWPYSQAERLGPELAKRGLAGLAVVPADRAALGMTGPPPAPGGWWRVVTGPGQPGDLAALLAGFGAVALIAGDERAVPVAEEVAAKLGLEGCDPATSAWRTDKTAMQRALVRARPRVPGPVTIEARGPKRVLAAAETIARAAGHPVVVKPAWSTSSVGVHVCHSLAEVTAAWTALRGRPGGHGEITVAVAVQEYLAGTKWTVDTVTVCDAGAPVHVVTSIWCERVSVTGSTGAGGGIAWGESWLVPPAIPHPRHPAVRVASYARQVLDAVGVVWGPACTEIVLTARGPRLVEVMARLAGCYPVHLVEEVTGQSQVTATVDALTDPAGLARRDPAAGDGRAVAQAWLAAPHDGWLDGTVLQEILALPCVVGASDGLVAGAEVRRTVDSPSSPGRLDLLGPPREVEEHIAAIRTLEHDLYRSRP
jgi:D-ala D-ala ligase C-terminus